MGVGYSTNTLYDVINASIGTPVNTGGTADLSSILGDFGNVSFVSRVLPRHYDSNLEPVAGSSTTESLPIWTITGSIYLHKLVGVVTVAMGTNHTAGHWRLEDGTNTPTVTSSGSALSNVGVGSICFKRGLSSSVMDVRNSSQCQIREAATAGLAAVHSSILVAKNGATTNLVYRYTTTNAPTTGTLQVFMEWEPISSDGAITVV